MPRLLPSSTESTLERQIIGAVTLLLHAVLAWCLLHVAGQGMTGTGTAEQGYGGALVVTFIAVPRKETNPQPSPTVPVPPASEPPAEHPATTTSHAIIPNRDPSLARTLSTTGDYVTSNMSSAASSLSPPPTTSTAGASSAQSGSPDNDLRASYHAALRARIVTTWQSLTTRAFPSGCTLTLNQSTGGAVTSSSANGCALSSEDRLQLEAAALMAQPLPYAGYEAVFAPELHLSL